MGPGRYDRVLQRVNALRREILVAGKAAAARAAAAASQRLAEQQESASLASLQALFSSGASDVDDLVVIAQKLRALPVAEPSALTLVLVGAPNVGKSSIVRVLSSGTPEVCDYPFTTRGIVMGHLEMEGSRCVVTDTPGLLSRSDAARNRMERLTLISLAYLPAAVLFVSDLSGRCGTDIEDQLAVREELRARFPGRLWMDVVSKCDLLEGGGGAVPEELAQAVRVSILEEGSVAALKAAVCGLLAALKQSRASGASEPTAPCAPLPEGAQGRGALDADLNLAA